MSHMGHLAAGRPRLVPKPSLLGAGAASGVLLFPSQPGLVTLASLTTARSGRLRWVVCEAQVAPSPLYPALDAPHWRLRPARGLPEFLSAYSEAGGSHHLALCPGHAASRVERLAAVLGCECRRV